MASKAILPKSLCNALNVNSRRSLSAADRGGPDFNDHRLIWDQFDKVHAKHPDMVLLHGGSPKGAELIAAKWATNRKVPQIAFKPDWTKHAKAAPFKRNDATLEVFPDQRHGVSWHRYSGQPRRQGQGDRHSGLEVRRRRRLSAALTVGQRQHERHSRLAATFSLGHCETEKGQGY